MFVAFRDKIGVSLQALILGSSAMGNQIIALLTQD